MHERFLVPTQNGLDAQATTAIKATAAVDCAWKMIQVPVPKGTSISLFMSFRHLTDPENVLKLEQYIAASAHRLPGKPNKHGLKY